MVGSELLCVNLAVVDFLGCICFYPLSILSSFSHVWLGSHATCVYYGLGCFIFGLCGMFTIAAISVIRYIKTFYGKSVSKVKIKRINKIYRILLKSVYCLEYNSYSCQEYALCGL